MMGDEEIIRFLRAKIRRNEFKLIEEKRKSKSDRRIAFFCYVENDKRLSYDRRLTV